MIDLYTHTTPNGRKISIMLEEVELPYKFHQVHINQGQQFMPEYLAINPNGKIPAIVDHDAGITVFESGAILTYLAEKTGKLLPTEPKARYQTLQWLFFQVAGVGPMFGQLSFFTHFAPEKVPYALERYAKETYRIYGVMDKRLESNEYIAGDFYSIADIAIFPWVGAYEFMGTSLDEYPHLKRWFTTTQQRPAVQRGMVIPPAA
jgi:GSH-dependent disulfide-bond oxidoreductase